MPRFLEQSVIGLLRVLVSYSTLLAQFSSLGFSIVAIRMFPYFRDPKTRDNGFFGLFAIISSIGFLLSMLFFLLYYQFFLKANISELLNHYIIWVLPITLFILLFNLSDSYTRALYDAIKGTIAKEIIQRIFILIAILLFLGNYIGNNGLVQIYVFAFAIPPLLLFYSLVKNKNIGFIPNFSFIDKQLKRKIIGVSIFGLISSFSNILVLNIDVLMIERYLDLSSTGIYSIAFFFGTLVLIPSRPLTRISAIILAESFKKNDFKNIDLVYKKSSINLIVIGSLLFLGLAINMENIIMIIGEDYRPGYYVILLIAFANVIQMSSGVLNQVVFNSEYYRYSSYFLLLFAFIIILTNILLIPKYGITGAAIATLISKFIYVFGRIIFVKIKLNLFPYQIKSIIPIVLSGLIYYLQTFITILDNYIYDLLFRSVFTTIIFVLFIYIFKISDDINLWIKQYLNKYILKK